MGNAATRPTMKDVRPLFAVRQDRLFGSVAQVFELVHEDEFDGLHDLLFGFSCRDQEDSDDISPQKLAIRRKEGYRLAKLMRDHSASMLRSLEMIYEASTAFNNNVVKWHPPLLEAILDVDLGRPDNLFLPEEIEILQSFFQGVDWDLVDQKLGKMSALPIKSNLDRGPVANTILRRSVKACRTYWRGVEKKSWSMSALKNLETRNENKLDTLQGTCEIFVACLLECAGVRFSLQELSNAWIATDASEKAA